MPVRYAHTLLFACPDCNRQIAVSRINDEANLEATDTQTFDVECENCKKIFSALGVVAKAHLVSPWPGDSR